MGLLDRLNPHQRTASANIDINTFNAAVDKHVAPLGARWLRNFLNAPLYERQHYISKVHAPVDDGVAAIQLPGLILAKVDTDALDTYYNAGLADDPETIKWVLTYMQGETYEQHKNLYLADFEHFVADAPWSKAAAETPPNSLAPENPVRIGGPLAAADQQLLADTWPHYILPTGESKPLTYLAEFLHAGASYCLFYDVDGGPLDEAYGAEAEQHYAAAYLILNASQPLTAHSLPAWIRMQPLPAGANQPLADEHSWRLPAGVPRAPRWVQDTEIPAEPHDRFMVQIPSVGNIELGDDGSLYIYTDGKGDYRIVFQSY